MVDFWFEDIWERITKRSQRCQIYSSTYLIKILLCVLLFVCLSSSFLAMALPVYFWFMSLTITLTVPIFLHQMRISTIHVSSVMLVAKLCEIQSLYKRWRAIFQKVKKVQPNPWKESELCMREIHSLIYNNV